MRDGRIVGNALAPDVPIVHLGSNDYSVDRRNQPVEEAFELSEFGHMSMTAICCMHAFFPVSIDLGLDN